MGNLLHLNFGVLEEKACLSISLSKKHARTGRMRRHKKSGG
jgi:hypothetical protein